MKVLVRPVYYRDVEEGAAYLAAHASERVAARWRDAVKRTARRIIDSPGAGHFRADLPIPFIRCLPVASFPRYLVFYRYDPEGGALTFLRVKYGGMDLPALFWPA